MDADMRKIKSNRIPQLGVMQGRLLPKYQGRYQAHPVGYWQDEFRLAQKLGLNFIEFILDYEQTEKNPLMNESGLAEIQRISEQTGVQVKTICADYFMKAPLQQTLTVHESVETLKTLIINAAKLGVKVIVIPCVDQSAFLNSQDMDCFSRNIFPARALAEKLEVSLALETDLPPVDFMELLERLDSPVFTVNYDTGNSASLGYDPVEELFMYGSRISDVHLKDRLKGGGSVELGCGATDFASVFDTLNQISYHGPLIMQAYRDEEGLIVFKKQLDWLKPYLKTYENKPQKR
jgi:L-ribulose-5-phosphate 3-epimerase